MNNNLRVEDNIPLPADHEAIASHAVLEVWQEFDPGTSITFPNKWSAYVGNLIKFEEALYGKRFTRKSLGDGEFRVWRTK